MAPEGSEGTIRYIGCVGEVRLAGKSYSREATAVGCSSDSEKTLGSPIAEGSRTPGLELGPGASSTATAACDSRTAGSNQ